MGLEMQITHKDKRSGKTVILSMFYDNIHAKNHHSDIIDNFILNGTYNKIVPSFNLSDIFENITTMNGNLFHYTGSLTVPPCTESVEWLLIDEIQPISEE